MSQHSSCPPSGSGLKTSLGAPHYLLPHPTPAPRHHALLGRAARPEAEHHQAPGGEREAGEDAECGPAPNSTQGARPGGRQPHAGLPGLPALRYCTQAGQQSLGPDGGCPKCVHQDVTAVPHSFQLRAFPHSGYSSCQQFTSGGDIVPRRRTLICPVYKAGTAEPEFKWKPLGECGMAGKVG